MPPVGQTDYYLFKHGAYPDDQYATNGKYPNMTGKELKLSGTRQDFDPHERRPDRAALFTGKGNKIFAQVTKNEAVRGSIQKAPQHFAIVLDNEIRSWPPIDYTQYPNGIDPTGTGAQITGIGEPEGGAEPRARAADRRAAGQLRAAGAHRRLGDARQGLARSRRATRRSAA